MDFAVLDVQIEPGQGLSNASRADEQQGDTEHRSGTRGVWSNGQISGGGMRRSHIARRACWVMYFSATLHSKKFQIYITAMTLLLLE